MTDEGEASLVHDLLAARDTLGPLAIVDELHNLGLVVGPMTVSDGVGWAPDQGRPISLATTENELFLVDESTGDLISRPLGNIRDISIVGHKRTRGGGYIGGGFGLQGAAKGMGLAMLANSLTRRTERWTVISLEDDGGSLELVWDVDVGVARDALRHIRDAERLARNPIADVKRPKTTDTAPAEVWDEDQSHAFLDSTRLDRHAWLWTLLLTRGLRRGEACGLQWPDIDLAAGRLSVRRARVAVRGQVLISEPKTGAGRRQVPLDDAVVAILRRHRTAQARERLAAGDAYEDAGWLFADQLGRRITPRT